MKENNYNNNAKFFNKAVYKTYMKRYAFIAVLYFFITEIIINFLYISMNGQKYTVDIKGLAKNYRVVENTNIYYIITITIVSVIFALVLFSYLQNEKSLTMLQSMPVSRKSLYFTNYLVFVSLMSSMLLLDSILIAISLTFRAYPFGEIMLFMLLLFVFKLLLALAVFSFTVFIGMLVSNFVLQTALVMIFFGLPMIIYRLADNMFKYIIIGYVSGQSYNSFDMKISPYFFLSEILARGRYNEDGLLIGYFQNKGLSISLTIAMIVLSFVFAYFLYKKRDLERCHEFIVFDLAKKVIVTIMALILSLIFASIMLIIQETTSFISEPYVYIAAFLGALLGYIIMRLIADKSIKILRYLPKSLIFAFIITAIMVFAGSNVIGFEDYVPKVEDVEVAYIYPANRLRNNVNVDFLDRSLSEVFYNINRSDDPIKLAGDDILLLEEGHRKLIESQRELEKTNDYNTNMGTYILYKLKNGRTVKRFYITYLDIDKKLELRQLESYKSFLSEAYDKHMDSLKSSMKRRANSGAYINSFNSDEVFPNLDDEAFDSFLEAYKKDYIVQLTNKERINKEKHSALFELVVGKSKSYVVNSSYENTLQWMRDNDYASVVDEQYIETPIRLSIYKGFVDEKSLLFDINDVESVANIYNSLNNINSKEIDSMTKEEKEPFYFVHYTFEGGEELVKAYYTNLSDVDISKFDVVSNGNLVMDIVMSEIIRTFNE